jgi:teichuronic acid biosynthesis protein TuaE
MKLILNKDLFSRLFFGSAVFGVAISYSKLYFFHVMLLILAVTYLLNITKQRGIIQVRKLPTRLHYIFYVMFGWYAISLLWSWNLILSCQYLMYILFGIAIVLEVIYYCYKDVNQDKIYSLVSSLFILEIFLALLETFTSIRWPISPFSPYVVYFGRSMGFDDTLANTTINYLLTRPTGFNWNPNNFATVMNLIFPFFLFHANRKIKYTGVLSLMTVIIATASRANFLAMLVMLFLYVFCFDKRRAVRGGIILLAALPLFGAAVNLLQGTDNRNVQRVLSVAAAMEQFVSSEESEDSVGVRQHLIKNGLSALVDTNGWGVGAGASCQVQIYANNTEGITSMHNFWIELLVDGGILFFIAFMLWYLYMVYALYRIGAATQGKLHYYGYATSLSMIGFLIGAVSASSVIYEFSMWLMFGFAIATVNNYERKKYENTDVSRSKFSTYAEMG